MKINPTQILYITLGPKNKWRNDCIYRDNTIRLGYIQISHELCLECKSKNEWIEVEEELKKHFDNTTITRRRNEIRNFYLSDENTL
ncbi:MAG: hypothetical protein RMX96_25215 [Nostoc sp. ChiSLP02]|nr:hypothetical protein [Nostoc sp. DedSLP05]MDZ8099587.1 hypothetical protein [Nostoc sp. DedSLP01]MDZ8188140.1 hypothetical protein [Nostoc sp. ChiSLP02]